MSSFRLPAEISQLQSLYESGSSADIGHDFWDPCFQHCVKYRRVAGYFSSSALITWASVLTRLAHSETVSIQLLISPILSEQDRDTLAKVASEQRRQAVLSEISDQLVLDAVTKQDLSRDGSLRQQALLWLLASGNLQIKFGFPQHVPDAGDLHKKYGLFSFPGGQVVAFTGSANETLNGHLKNFEEVEVFKSWESHDERRVSAREELFEREWTGKVQSLTILELSERAISKIQTRAPKTNPFVPTVAEPPPADYLSEFMTGLWPHQLKAIENFESAQSGVIEMATGTGKTRVALALIGRLIKSGVVGSTIISTGSVDLLRQWVREVASFIRDHNLGLQIYRHFSEYHEGERFILDPGRSILVISRTSLSHVLKALMPSQKKLVLLIYDEVHGLGSPELRKSLNGLSNGIDYVLGLSATPEREYDDEGNLFIDTHVGTPIYEYDLADAIHDGILAPFNYFHLNYLIDDNDRQRLRNVYSRQAARRNTASPMSQEELWTELARVYKTSEAKLPLFEQFIKTKPHLLKRSILFVETKEYGDKVLEIVHRYRDDFHTYYADDDAEVLRRFANGDLHCLITCHKLSEGIDIRSLETVIMFSSARAKLETIQRIGRCLRRNPADPQKIANIVDFIRLSSENGSDDNNFPNSDEEREVWLTELSKVRKG